MSVALAAPINYTTLGTALLPQVKTHCRVDFDHDDEFLKSATARAIQQFENETETKVFAASFAWAPADAEFSKGGAQSPISPVKSFTADAGGTDVSADYAFETASAIDGAGTFYLVGTMQSGLVVTIGTGYADAAAIPPGILDKILQMTATYYENRELFLPSGQFLNPLGLRQQIAGYWLPKA